VHWKEKAPRHAQGTLAPAAAEEEKQHHDYTRFTVYDTINNSRSATNATPHTKPRSLPIAARIALVW